MLDETLGKGDTFGVDVELSNELELDSFPKSTKELLALEPEEQLEVLHTLTQKFPNIQQRIAFLARSGYVPLDLDSKDRIKPDSSTQHLERGHVVLLVSISGLHARRHADFLRRAQDDGTALVVDPDKIGLYSNFTDLIDNLTKQYLEDPFHSAFDSNPETLEAIINRYSAITPSEPEVYIGMVAQPTRPDNGTTLKIASLEDSSAQFELDMNEVVTCCVIGISEEDFTSRQDGEIKHHDKCRLFIKGYWITGKVVGFGYVPGQLEVLCDDGKTYTVSPNSPVVDFRDPNSFEPLPPLYEPEEHVEIYDMYTYLDETGIEHLIEIIDIESNPQDRTNTRWITFRDTSSMTATRKLWCPVDEFFGLQSLKKIELDEDESNQSKFKRIFSVWSGKDEEYLPFRLVHEDKHRGLIYGKSIRVRKSALGEITTCAIKDVFFHPDTRDFFSFVHDSLDRNANGSYQPPLVEFTVDGVQYEGTFDTVRTLPQYIMVTVHHGDADTKHSGEVRHHVTLDQLGAFKKGKTRLEKDEYLPVLITCVTSN